jgi:AraC-like DNA-binding protein
MSDALVILDTQRYPHYISSGYRTFDAGKRHVDRRIDICVLVFILEGKLYFSEDGQATDLSAGQWYLERPDKVFEGHRPGPPVHFYFVHFSALQTGSGAAGFQLTDPGSYNTPAQGTVHLPVSGSFDPNVFTPLFDRLEQIRQTTPNHLFLFQSVFLELLSVLTDTVYPVTDPDKQLVRDIVDYLTIHYRSEIRIAELGSRFHFSADYLARLMRRHIGIGPKAYLQQLRLRQAMELLHHTDYPVEQVAEASGYRDITVFFRSFKSATGETPAKWRRNHRR